MTGKRERRWVGVIVFLAIMTTFLPTMIGAEEFGIIRGRILDKVTGEPLP